MTEFRPTRFEILPPIVKNLLIINALFFLAQNTIGANGMFSVENLFALHSWHSEYFKPWQLLTYMFLHGNFSHLFFNMLGLWMLGSVLENMWGAKRFLTFYIVCGLAGALATLISSGISILSLSKEIEAFIIQNNITADSRQAEEIQAGYRNFTNVATLGASAAIYGVTVAFCYLFPNSTFYIYFLIPVKAKWIITLMILSDIFSIVYEFITGNQTGIGHWAHLGGALLGFIIVITWNKTNRRNFY